MNTFVRLMPALFACVATQVLAGDPPTPKAVDPDKSAASATAVNADPAPAATPAQTKAEPEASAPTAAADVAKPGRLVLDDKTLTNAEVSQILAQGYRPQKGRGDDVLYCRSEQPIGTRFAKKTCKTADQMKAVTRDSQEIIHQQQMPGWNPTGK